MTASPDNLLARARQGIEPIDLPDEIKGSALANFEDWLGTDKLARLVPRSDYSAILSWMVKAEKFDLLIDSFYQMIPFGTGGRRGPVGVGPNRINPYTIASSVQGHVEYLRQRFGEAERLKVVIANDVRAFHDIRGTYPDDLENPLLGLSSKDFARIASAVYSAAGVEVYALPASHGGYISTPELSFLIRWVGAHGGINVSASHNHPDDNGSKFYNAEGGQEIPPDDEELANIVERVKEINIPAENAAASSQLIHAIPPEARQAFIDMNLGLRLRPSGGAGKFVFTSLHGTGVDTVGRCLEEMGYAKGRQLFYVVDQCEFHSDFRHVTFRSPNPEVPESLQMGIKLAEEVGGDILLATDPDADRLGGATRNGDGYAILTGNEFAAILARYRLDALEALGRLPERPLGIKTEVTTDLVRRVFESRNGVVVGNLLVGFKYIAAVLGSLERTGRYGDLHASLDDFVLAAEESHGFMLTPEVRDKDAAGAAVVLAELTSELSERGETVYDYLVDTYKRYGYHANTVRSTVMQGAAGSANIRKIQQLLRSNPPKEIGGRAVLDVNDYWDEVKYGPFLSQTDKSSRNLISYTVEGGIKATIRPSGTEPKNKLYLELAAAPLGPDATLAEFTEHRQAVDREVKEFSNKFLAQMLYLIGVSVPEYAFEISDLVPLHFKVDFCDRFLPEFQRRAEAVGGNGSSEGDLATWVDESLRPYGPDARILVRRAFQAYASTCDESDVLAMQRRVFADV